jgi:hypothetical protein
MIVYDCVEWQCRYVFPNSKRCCTRFKDHEGDHDSTAYTGIRRRDDVQSRDFWEYVARAAAEVRANKPSWAKD